MIRSWTSFNGFNCTINTTEDCNLRCKYCYEICKKPGNIELETAKKFIDLIFTDSDIMGNLEERPDAFDGLILDFIGGDALMNVDILDDICRYANSMYMTHNRFKKRGWRMNISSNGTLFKLPKVREFCEKWADNLSLGVSIDGCPEIHDKNRIYCDGSGSMKDILEWWPWFQKWFPIGSRQTKATANRDTIPYIYESLRFMHETLGLKWIHQNFIAEDMGLTEEDLKTLDEQLKLCCDYCLEHKNDLYWSMFDFRFQFPYCSKKETPDSFERASCGSGQMPTCSIDGKIYPCFRWLPHTQTSKDTMVLGDVEKGVDKEKAKWVREMSTSENCSNEECKNCEFESSCVWCVAGSYAEFNEFKRATHLCEITKLQCKWAKNYVKRLANEN